MAKFSTSDKGILKKKILTNTKSKMIRIERKKFLLSQLRNWESSKKAFFDPIFGAIAQIQFSTDFKNKHHSELRR